MPHFSSPELHRFAAALFVAASTPPDLAATVATSLIAADLRGHESHGIMRVARYIERMRNGTMQPAMRPVIVRRQGVNAVVDGVWGLGQVSAQAGTKLAAEICREHGQAGVALQRTHHIGRLGDYVESLAATGLVGIVMSGGGNRGGSVAPYGGRQRIFGTNPFAIALPTPSSHPPLVLDFATSSLPEGRVAVARANQRPLPPGCLVDRDGRASTNAADFYAGGALLPFGGHKGSALMVMVEILATALAGSVPISSPDYQMGFPTLIIALSVDAFVDPGFFAARVDEVLTHLRESPPADGFSEVLSPGEIEDRTRRQRERDGIPLSDGVWAELTALAQSLGVAIPASLSR